MRSVVTGNRYLGLPERATSIIFQHLPLSQLKDIKEDNDFSNNLENDDSQKSKKVVMPKIESIFKTSLDNENKDPKETNKNNPRK